MRKLLVIAILFLLFTSMLVIKLPTNVSSVGTTIYVDDDNTDGPWDGSVQYPFQYIQDGVDAASSEDTVYVKIGTYEELISIDTNNIILKGEDEVQTKIDGVSNGDVVTITSDDITIEKFTIEGSKSGYSGIKISGTESTQIESTKIKNCKIVDNCYGIKIDYASSTTINEDCTIESNTFGVYIDNSDSSIIEKNTFEENWFEDITILNSDSIRIEKNVVQNNLDFTTAPALYDDNHGIYLYQSKNCIIDDNTISRNYHGIFLTNSNNNDIKRNTISNTFRGIYLEESKENTIQLNKVYSNRFDGIHLDQSNTNFIKNNNIWNNKFYGIFLGYSMNNQISYNFKVDMNGWGIYLLGSNSNFIGYNNVRSNDYVGIYGESSKGNILKRNLVENNLLHEIRFYDRDYNEHDIEVGAGDCVDNGEIYYVWCGENPDDSSDSYDGKFQTWNQGQDTNGDGKEDGPWKTLGKAVKNVEPGDVVYVKYGIYEETLILNSGDDDNIGNKGKPITFQGYYQSISEPPPEDKLPVINGIRLYSIDYYIIKNFFTVDYAIGLFLISSNHNTFDNIIGEDLGAGVSLRYSHYNSISNCKMSKLKLGNVQINELQYSHYNQLRNCEAIVNVDSNIDPSDYLFVIRNSHDNLINGFKGKFISGEKGINWGIGIKDWIISNKMSQPKGITTYVKPNSYNNIFIDCETYDEHETLTISNNFFLKHCSHHNKIINCISRGDGPSLRISNGAHHNEIIGFKKEGSGTNIHFYDQEGEVPSQYGEYMIKKGNIFENCIFEGGTGIYYSGADNNLVKNCVFYKPTSFIVCKHINNNNMIKNCIITGGTGSFSTGINPSSANLNNLEIKYCDFYNNNFNCPSNDETWVYDVESSCPNTWEKKDLTNKPSYRLDHAMAYDPIHKKGVLFGGQVYSGSGEFSEGYSDETWVYDVTAGTWTKKDVPGPVEHIDHSMVYDSDQDWIVLFAGRYMTNKYHNGIWVYDVGTESWEGILNYGDTPDKRIDHSMVYDSFRDVLFLFGGYKQIENDPEPDVYKSCSDTYRAEYKIWSGTEYRYHWTKEEHEETEKPSARYGHAMAYDDYNKKIVLFGGLDTSGYDDETWVYNVETEAWVKKEPVEGIKPPERTGHAMVFDSNSKSIVLYGGKNSNGNLDDTWIYDVATNEWEEKEPYESPSMRFGHSMIFDQHNNEVLLFGGETVFNKDPLFVDPENSDFHLRSFYGRWDGDSWDYDDLDKDDEFDDDEISPCIDAGDPADVYDNENQYNGGRINMGAYGNTPEASKSSTMGGRLENLEIIDNIPGTKLRLTTENNMGTWHEQQLSPSARYYHAMVYDSVNNKIVMFGGYDGSDYLDDTWVYDVQSNTWTEMNPSINPGARAQHIMVYDSTNNKVILFGGYLSGSGLNGETWVYDVSLNTWTKIREYDSEYPDNDPSPRNVHAMAFDSANSKAILFGGYDGSNVKSDTWAYDFLSNTWTRMRSGGTGNDPSARQEHAITYDSYERKIVLFGGRLGGINFEDTWVYDYIENIWIKRKPYEKPEGRRLPSLTYDSNSKKVVLFGGYDGTTYYGDTWVYDTKINEWTEVRDGADSDEPSERWGHAIVHDSANNKVIIFGGVYVTTEYDDTWIYSTPSNEWKNSEPSPFKPTKRREHAMTYDDFNEKAVLFGSGGDDETWLYDISSDTWIKSQPPSPKPSGRSKHAMTYDSANRKIVLFGGHTDNCNGETWLFDIAANKWIEKSTGGTPGDSKPTARRSHAMAYDSYNNKIVLFGGYDGSNFLEDTWVYDLASDTWEEKSEGGTSGEDKPSPRDRHNMVFNSGAKKIVLFGGYTSSGEESDETWEYDVSTDTWNKMEPLNKPSARYLHSMAYVSENNIIVLFGGSGDSSGANDETWIYQYDDESSNWNWYQKNPTIKPSERYGHSLIYDSNNKKLMLFGGGNDIENNGETWIYNINDYYNLGIYTSGTFLYDADKYKYITWRGNTDPDGFVRFQVGISDDSFDWDFVGPDGTSQTYYSDVTGGNLFNDYQGQYVRYKAYLTTSFGGNSPFLYDVSFTYGKESDLGVELNSPNGGENFIKGEYYPITWSAVGDFQEGARDGSNYLDDTWIYDGSNWNQVTPTTNARPPAREGLSMVFDSENKKIVLFGGYSGSYYGDTWTYDIVTNTWTKKRDQNTQGSDPSPRRGHAMVYDTSTKKIVLFGGWDGSNYLNDVWLYDLSENTWTLERNGTDPNDPPKRAFHAMAFNPSSTEIVLFGGEGIDGGVDEVKLLGDTWILEDSSGYSWTPKDCDPAPTARKGHSMTYHSTYVFLYGGLDSSGQLGNAYYYVPTTPKWQVAAYNNPKPWSRDGHAMVYDSNNQESIVFGGFDGGRYLDETWGLSNGFAWTYKNPELSPPIRKNHAMVYDSFNQVIVLFGGDDGTRDLYFEGPISLHYSIDNGVTWNKIVEGLANTGSYNWKTPDLESANTLIKISVKDVFGNTITDVSNAYFAISSPP